MAPYFAGSADVGRFQEWHCVHADGEISENGHGAEEDFLIWMKRNQGTLTYSLFVTFIELIIRYSAKFLVSF